MDNRRIWNRIPRLKPTTEDVYFSRRKLIKQLGYGGMIAAVSCALPLPRTEAADDLEVEAFRKQVLDSGLSGKVIKGKFPANRNEKFDGKGVKLTDELVAGTHNNFYEFIPGRGGPVYRFVDKFVIDPWKIEVSGECMKPTTFDLDDLFKFDQEERVYRFRCVETWAMDVPWTGVQFSKLLEKVQPKASAKYVRFVTANDRKTMPGVDYSIKWRHGYKWPYHEALRMDEAMNELTLMATGIFGRPLPKQHGAPARIVAPWKYGYKSPKSIVKIELTEKKPPTFWSSGPYAHEYGFLSNINPNIPHPRWSQASEYMLVAGASKLTAPRRKSLIFGGYGEFVGKMYPNAPTKPQKALGPGQIAR